MRAAQFATSAASRRSRRTASALGVEPFVARLRRAAGLDHDRSQMESLLLRASRARHVSLLEMQMWLATGVSYHASTVRMLAINRGNGESYVKQQIVFQP